LLACVIVAAAAFEDQLAEEGRWRSKGWESSWRKGDLIDRSWSKGDLRGWNKGSWNKGDLGWGKGESGKNNSLTLLKHLFPTANAAAPVPSWEFNPNK